MLACSGGVQLMWVIRIYSIAPNGTGRKAVYYELASYIQSFHNQLVWGLLDSDFRWHEGHLRLDSASI